ncbi:hypothetical protein BDR07DRAFT_257338 [Suillus spraguei]|nr:hypothetical protein BDR07DRAFT_257338 [Suillus spraguei]
MPYAILIAKSMSSETGCSGVPYLFSLELLVSLATFCAPPICIPSHALYIRGSSLGLYWGLLAFATGSSFCWLYPRRLRSNET